MAASARALRQVQAAALQCRRPFAPTRSARSLVTLARPQTIRSTTPSAGGYGRRYLSRTSLRANQSQTAPNAKAYLESGAIAGGGNLVDVSKVLVIGSGGLAIGQAGEFDYSGKCRSGITSRRTHTLRTISTLTQCI